MQRRSLLKSGALLALPATAALSGCQGSLPAAFASWRSAREAVLELLFKPMTRPAPWSTAQMLLHCAQSIRYSIEGFPAPKPAWFQASLGSAAYAFFDARGAMSHDLGEPIPGAPALDPDLPLKTAVQALLDEMQRFADFRGELKPHFAYGQLTRAQYERAHLMHLANHWQQLSPVARA